ncbi:MAG: tellurite resistance TerB family protein, partial [Planctomycetaceae bacterium]|nr:tellurite resistance TerB family protein [Planctomycetaceae bacterium]
MNAIDILGDLLGHKTSGGGLGGDVLKDIFRRGSTPKRGSANRQSKPASSRDIQQDAEDLEDLLNVANDRSSQRTHSSGRHENRPHQSTHQAPPISVPNSRPSGRFQHRSAERSLEKDNQHAEILIEAMLNAAKSDGEINPEEQRAIMKRLD